MKVADGAYLVGHVGAYLNVSGHSIDNVVIGCHPILGRSGFTKMRSSASPQTYRIYS